MKYLPIVAIVTLLNAQSYNSIIKHISKTPAMKSAKLAQEALNELSLSAEGKNMPRVDISIEGAWLKDTPKMILHTGYGASNPLPMGTTRQFRGELKLSYPLFTGYAITAQIQKSRLEAQKARLKVLDLKRNLILQATQMYGAIEAIEATISALLEAKRATILALKKAKGFYKNGLIPLSDLYNIKAKLYDIDSAISQAKSQKEQLLNQLSYISGMKISKIDNSISIKIPKSSKIVKQNAHRYRSDINALKTLLSIKDTEISLAKSRYYPTVGVVASLKRHGDTLSLNGDGFRNPDESFVGVNISYNIFNGGSDKHNLEAVRYQKLSAYQSYIDYLHRVDTEIDNAFIALRALHSKLKSAYMQVKSQKEYYRLTKGRFDNQLSSADELSRSIADLANAKANLYRIKSQIEVQRAKIRLLEGVERFEHR